jgi:hypothetical protein
MELIAREVFVAFQHNSSHFRQQTSPNWSVSLRRTNTQWERTFFIANCLWSYYSYSYSVSLQRLRILMPLPLIKFAFPTLSYFTNPSPHMFDSQVVRKIFLIQYILGLLPQRQSKATKAWAGYLSQKWRSVLECVKPLHAIVVFRHMNMFTIR